MTDIRQSNSTDAPVRRLRRPHKARAFWHRFFLPVLFGLRGNRLTLAGRRGFRLFLTVWIKTGARNNRIEIGRNFRHRHLFVVIVGKDNRLIIGDDVAWNGRIEIQGRGIEVRIGNRCDAKGVHMAVRGVGLEIGDDCLFARGVEIRTTDIHKIEDRDTGDVVNPPARVVIGDHVWVGGQVLISKSSAIPDGCVVGARSFVNRPFEEPDCVIAGNPARVVRRNIAWTR